jgi:hypothetical protein
LDVKATNILSIQIGTGFWVDFGSCKPIGHRITSSTFQFYFEGMAFKSAHPKYHWFMFLVFILIETMEDRRQYVQHLMISSTPTHVDFDKVMAYARSLQENKHIGFLIKLLMEMLRSYNFVGRRFLMNILNRQRF